MHRRTLLTSSLAALGSWSACRDVRAAAPPSPPTIDELLAMFRGVPAVRARFREEKHLALLDAPLVNEGSLAYAPPGRLVRHIEKPLASTVLIDGGKLSFGDASGKQTLDLGTNPVARAFVDSFLLLLAGDRAGLSRTFALEMAPWPEGRAVASTGAKSRAWQLTLVPRAAPMNKILRALTLHGHELTIHDLDLREASGDWSHTVFSEVDVTHAITPAEQARLFRIPGR